MYLNMQNEVTRAARPSLCEKRNERVMKWKSQKEMIHLCSQVSYSVLFSWAQKKKQKADNSIVCLTDSTVLSQWEPAVSVLDFQGRLIPGQGPQAFDWALEPECRVTLVLSAGIISALSPETWELVPDLISTH